MLECVGDALGISANLIISTLHIFSILISVQTVFVPSNLFLSSRILVFSQRVVTNVEVYIDGTHVGRAEQAKGPLYTLPWDPESFSTGLHTLRVQVKVIQCLKVGHNYIKAFSETLCYKCFSDFNNSLTNINIFQTLITVSQNSASGNNRYWFLCG